MIWSKRLTDLYSPKVYALDRIRVVVLKNSESSLSYMLTEFFNMYLKECCFPSWWKVLSVVLEFKNVGERSAAKNTTLLASFLLLLGSYCKG